MKLKRELIRSRVVGLEQKRPKMLKHETEKRADKEQGGRA